MDKTITKQIYTNNKNIIVFLGIKLRNQYININCFNFNLTPRLNISVVDKSKESRYINKQINLTIGLFTFSITFEIIKYKFF